MWTIDTTRGRAEEIQEKEVGKEEGEEEEEDEDEEREGERGRGWEQESRRVG